MKRSLYLVSAAMIVAAGAGQAAELSWGVDVVSDYVSDGITQTNGKPAIQPWVEFSSAGFYVGGWASNVEFSTGEDIEVDLSLGYRMEAPSGLAFDVSYTRYWYNTGDCCGSFDLSLGLPVTPQISATGDLSWDPSADTMSMSVTGDYAFSDKLGASLTYGHSEANSNNFWALGGSYSVSDQMSVYAEYHDTTNTSGRALIGLSFATSGY